jgi:hypothetical protein
MPGIAAVPGVPGTPSVPGTPGKHPRRTDSHSQQRTTQTDNAGGQHGLGRNNPQQLLLMDVSGYLRW